VGKKLRRDERTLIIALMPAGYAARRCSSQIAVPSEAAARATKMPASMSWNDQNRPAGC
jgi:hypothetical protein